MIISASRRTDIPAFYAPWFFNRLQEGYLLVPNPFDPRTLSRISLGRDVVDCIVFWTKNPAPMLPRLGELSGSTIISSIRSIPTVPTWKSTCRRSKSGSRPSNASRIR